jgi:hypothetical protein
MLKTSNQNKAPKRNDKRTPANPVSLSCWLGITAAVDVSLKCLEIAADLIKNSPQHANIGVVDLATRLEKHLLDCNHV